jgi:hypothetical protein
LAAPVFFVDRSLGRLRVPELLRSHGWPILTLAEHYGIPQDENITDVEWLKLAGESGWPVLMKDERIRYRGSERQAVVSFGVRAFCLTSGNLRSQEMADCFLRHEELIWTEAKGSGPALFAVSKGGVRRVALGE